MRRLCKRTHGLTPPPKSVELRKLKLTSCAPISDLPERDSVCAKFGQLKTRFGRAALVYLHRD
jgi:hypothetical protein